MENNIAKVTNPGPPILLSICVSTYNRAEWLAKSLKNWETLYPVPLHNVEFLVCDNTSTDRTPEVVEPYVDRSGFAYYRNEHNVGMLGNLRETARRARGQYIWILGDDDLLMPGSIERILQALGCHPDVALLYLNYAYTNIEDARTVINFDAFFREATPIVEAEADRFGAIRTICARNENFFTAIYTLVFRRDHAIKAYSQDTSGRPFSTMLTCIPTTYYVLGHLMDEPGVWIGTPNVVVNWNVSWKEYLPIWFLERFPEIYEEAERQGADRTEVDRWRCRHLVTNVMYAFQKIYTDDQLNNAEYFLPGRFVQRFKHLSEFHRLQPRIRQIYATANANGHPFAQRPVSHVFPRTDLRTCLRLLKQPDSRNVLKVLVKEAIRPLAPPFLLRLWSHIKRRY